MQVQTTPVVIVGLGYVGLPLLLEFSEAGRPVVGIDTNDHKVHELNRGICHVDNIGNSKIEEALSTGRVSFTSDFSVVANARDIVICVPTPLRKSRDPDTSCIEGAMDAILPHLSRETLIVLESTTYPGTTRELIGDRLQAAGMNVGRDVFVAFSPERVDPGNPTYETKNTPKVIAGLTSQCLERSIQLYQGVIEKLVPLESPEEAELCKLLENTFRAVNIALVNEFALLSDRMKINIWNVIQGAASKPFGFMPFYPGPGIGGHCIPLDPVYLGWKAKSYDFYSRFIETASDINANMPRFVVSKLIKLANDAKIVVNGAKVVIGGVAYKPNIKDERESPALELIELLSKDYGAQVKVVDPLVAQNQSARKDALLDFIDPKEAIQWKPDVFLLVTPHQSVDWKRIAQGCRIVFDTRNAMQKDPAHPHWASL